MRHSATLALTLSLGVGAGALRASAPATSGAASAATMSAATAPAIYATPLATCEAYCNRTLDASPDALDDVCLVTVARLKPAWAAMNGVTLAHRRVERAVATRFPKGDLELSGGLTIEIAMKSILARLPKAKIEIAKDNLSATVTYPDEEKPDYPKAEPFYLIRDGKGWKVDEVRTEPVTEDHLRYVDGWRKEINLCNKLADDVAAGKVATLEEAKKRLDEAARAGAPKE